MTTYGHSGVSKCPEKCELIYKRLMLPDWIRNNAEWNCENQGDELVLRIPQDSSDWENIFRIPLIPDGCLKRNADITVIIRCGVIMPVPPPPPPPPRRPVWRPPVRRPKDPLSFMITDRDFCVGIQLRDPETYGTTGPYLAVEGDFARARLRNPNIDVATTVTSTANINPDQFEITLKPSELYGTAFSSIDFGHKIVALYSDSLNLSKGLWLDVYRFMSNEEYRINYIEVEIYLNSKAL